MRHDNKIISFPGRNEGNQKGCLVYDDAVRKDLADAIEWSWPRTDEHDPRNVARGVINHDYTNRRLDEESWMLRRTNDDHENIFADDWYINEHREKENPDQFAFEEDFRYIAPEAEDEEV